MPDYSSMSDADLMALVQPKAAAPQADYSKMSDADLMKLVGKPGAADTATDVAKSAGIGVVKGGIGLAGLPGDLAELGARGIDRATQYIGGKLGLDVQPRPDRPADYGSADIQKAVEGQTGEFYKPQTTAGQYAQTVGEFAPAAIGGPGGIIARGARVLAPGLASEGAGQLTKGTAAEPYARVAGAVAGGLAPSALARTISPLPISAERSALVNTLKNEGVDALTAGQVSGRKGLQWMESALSDMPLGGGKAASIAEKQGEQFTGAALRRMGISSERATPDVLDAGVKNIGDKFNTLAGRNTLTADQQLAQDLTRIKSDYDSLTIPSQRAPIVDKIVNDIQASGGMAGDQYQAVRSQFSKQAEKLKVSNPPLADAFRETRKALDGAMNRSISPADRSEWAQARREWGNWKTLEKSNISGEGNISPLSLRQAARSGNRGGFARGQGDFAELARAGGEILKPLPQSGTAPRQNIQNIVTALGAGAGGIMAGAPGVAGGIAAGMATPAVLSRILMSKPVQGYLKNQVSAGLPTDPKIIANLLLSTRGHNGLLTDQRPQ